MPANALLEALTQQQRDDFSPHFEAVELPLGETLHEANQPIRYVYFVTEGVVSVVNEPNTGEIVEVATIGNEGFVGVPILLAARSMASRSLVQIPGAAIRIEAERFKELLNSNGKFRELLLRYALALMNQIAQCVSCNRLHEVQERCARWLLQTDDRVSGNSFNLTHEFLGQMLGCHRPTVSIAIGMLIRAGFITSVRGVITVVDRKGLESASCPCYRTIVQQYRNLLNE